VIVKWGGGGPIFAGDRGGIGNIERDQAWVSRGWHDRGDLKMGKKRLGEVKKTCPLN